MIVTEQQSFMSKLPRIQAEGVIRYAGIILEGSPGIGKTAFASSVVPNVKQGRLVRIPMANRTKEEFGTFLYPMIEEKQVPVLDDEGKPKVKNGQVVTKTEKFLSVANALSETSITPLLEENIGDDFGVLIFDDVTLSDPRVQGALLEIVQFGVIGGERIGKNVLIFLTGNTVNDGAYAVEWSSALIGRCVFLKPKPNFKRWLSFEENLNICPSVVSFLHENPRFFCTSDIDDEELIANGEERIQTDETGRDVAPRDWTRLGTAMAGIGGFKMFKPDFVFTSPLVYASSMIGAMAAEAYVQHARTYSIYPTAVELFEDKTLWENVPKDKKDFLAGTLAVVFSLRSHAIKLINENLNDEKKVSETLKTLFDLTIMISVNNNEVISFLLSSLINWASSDNKKYGKVLVCVSEIITRDEFKNNKQFRAILKAQWENRPNQK